jgi:hypothetical protein
MLMGYAVAQIVEALRYKPEGRGFGFLWGHCIFYWRNPSGRTNFGKGTGLSWADIRLWSTKGLSVRPRCIGTARARTHCKSVNQSISQSINQSIRLHYGPGVVSSSYRNEYQEYFLKSKGGQCVGLTALPPSCADCLEIVRISNSWSPQGLSKLV